MGGGTPLPLSFGIMELQAKTPKIFDFKGLIVKIFWNKELRLSKSAEMALGQLRGPSWFTDAPQKCPNQIIIVAHDGP